MERNVANGARMRKNAELSFIEFSSEFSMSNQKEEIKKREVTSSRQIIRHNHVVVITTYYFQLKIHFCFIEKQAEEIFINFIII